VGHSGGSVRVTRAAKDVQMLIRWSRAEEGVDKQSESSSMKGGSIDMWQYEAVQPISAREGKPR
jgi:hypothetical protein